MHLKRRSDRLEPGRRPDSARVARITVCVALLALACDDTIEPRPPKQSNVAPETYLVTESDSLRPQFYGIRLQWLGTDADGRVVRYRYRWDEVCTQEPCPVPPDWIETTALFGDFTLPVPGDSALYQFEIAAVDNNGQADESPASQEFDFRNAAPTVEFVPGTLPTRTLPAVTFILSGTDPDTTETPEDADTTAHLTVYRSWLNGNEAQVIETPFAQGSITLRPEDFAGGPAAGDSVRTVFVQVVDDGGAVSLPIEHTWLVDEPPVDGILLVDDCRMGGMLEDFSDQSFRRVLETWAPGRYVVMDVDLIPYPNAPDFEAQLSLFDRIVWYTDADTTSSGALELARGGLEALLDRNGRLFLSSGLVFGTRSAFGDRETRFRQSFGIGSVFTAPLGGTNFSISLVDTVHAAVHPGLERFTFLSQGLRGIVECFDSVSDADTRSLYFYPESTLVRDTFVNPVQYDVGVSRLQAGGPSTVYVSFPIGVPINSNMGENEIEIREMLRLAGILEP